MAGQRAAISTGESTTVGNWNGPKNRVKGGEKTKVINARLDTFLSDAKIACQYLADRNKPVSALTIKNQMLGIGPDAYSLVKCFENFVKEIKLKIGSEYEEGTLKNYNVNLGHLKEFIKKKYQAEK